MPDVRRLVVLVLALALGVIAALPARTDESDGEDATGELRIHLVRIHALVHGRTAHFAEGGPLPGNDEWAGVPPLAGRSGEEPLLPLGTCDEIIELLKAAVRPEYWQEVERADIRSAGEKTLVLRSSTEVAQEVAAFVAALERLNARTLTVDVQAIRLERDEVLALRAVPSEEALDSDRVDALLLEAGRSGPAVSVTTHPGHPVGVFGGRQRTWLGSADARVAEASAIADPIVHAGHVGLSVSVEAVPVPGRDEAVVTLHGTLSRHVEDRLVRTEATGTLELPTYDVTQVRSILTLPVGQWSLVDGVGPESRDGGVYLLVRVTPHVPPPVRAARTCRSMPLVPEQDGSTYELAYFPIPALTHPIDHRDVWGTPLAPSRKSRWDGSLWGHGCVWPEEGTVDFLREMGEDTLWEEPASIEVRDAILHVRHTPSMLRAVEAWLSALRAHALWTLETTVQVVDLPESTAREVGSGGPLAREQVVVLKEALSSGDATRLAVARVLSLVGSRNYVDAGRRISYVRDYDPVVAQQAAILKPVVGTYLEGIEAEVSGGLACDGQSILLEIRMQTLEAKGELRSVGVPGGGALDLPELETFRVRTSCHAPLGVLTVAGSWAENGRRRLLLVTPRLRR